MIDPRGILEEFVRACDGYRGSREQRFDDGAEVGWSLDAESRRSAYREKQEGRGECRSCRTAAKPGRKYCERHLALANARAVRSLRARRQGA